MTPGGTRAVERALQACHCRVKFASLSHLVGELNDFLEAKERRIHEAWKQDPFVVKLTK